MGYDTKDKKGRFFSGSHTELEQVITAIRRIHPCRGREWVEMLGRVSRNVVDVLTEGRLSRTALQMLEMFPNSRRVSGEESYLHETLPAKPFLLSWSTLYC